MKDRSKIFKVLRKELSLIRKALEDVAYIRKYLLELPEVEHGVFYLDFENVLGYRTPSLDSGVSYSQLLIAPNVMFYKFGATPSHLFTLTDELEWDVDGGLYRYETLKGDIIQFSSNIRKLSTKLDFFLYIEGDYIHQDLINSIFSQLPAIEEELKKGRECLSKLRDFLSRMEDRKGKANENVDRAFHNISSGKRGTWASKRRV
jgi:hypothetical protein